MAGLLRATPSVMSEMLANQYFISERYFEALDEYSKLSEEMKNDPLIKNKMIVCATLNKNFELAMVLLKELIRSNLYLSEDKSIELKECPGCDAINKLEKKITGEKGLENVKKMQLAILRCITDQTRSLEIFENLKDSIYADIVRPFLQELKTLNQ